MPDVRLPDLSIPPRIGMTYVDAPVNYLSLDKQAFILTHHDTRVRDFYDEAELKAVYYAEVEALIKRETGASKVVVFDHTVRTAYRAVERGLRTPVFSDDTATTEKSGPQRVRD